MDAMQRRQQVRRVVEEAEQPVSASALAKRLGVSRQVIVGDVALLRAEGCDIISTARGYLCHKNENANRHIAKLVCRHRKEQTQNELYTIVDMGGSVLDVIVEHAVYGELAARLELHCRRDVDLFLERFAGGEPRLLSDLTGGLHLHTISCPDAAVFAMIKAALQEQDLLYPEEST